MHYLGGLAKGQNLYQVFKYLGLIDKLKLQKLDEDVFAEVRGESETLGGLLLNINSDLPKLGAEIVYADYVFKIDAVNNKRIVRVKVTIPENED